MFKCITCLLAGAAVVIGVDLAQAAQRNRYKPNPAVIFQKLDKNHDGVLTPREFVGRRSGAKAMKAAKVFQMKDTNHDGVLTFAEFTTRIGKKR